MTVRVALGGDDWAELRTVKDLSGADQEAWFEAYDEIMEPKPTIPPRPDPDNPAQMLPGVEPTMTNREGRLLRDKTLGVLITAWSLDAFPLPFTTETRLQPGFPVAALNVLYEASVPMRRALQGSVDTGSDDPKSATPTGSGGSADTSADSSPGPLPAPPAEPSSTL